MQQKSLVSASKSPSVRHSSRKKQTFVSFNANADLPVRPLPVPGSLPQSTYPIHVQSSISTLQTDSYQNIRSHPSLPSVKSSKDQFSAYKERRTQLKTKVPKGQVEYTLVDETQMSAAKSPIRVTNQS